VSLGTEKGGGLFEENKFGIREGSGGTNALSCHESSWARARIEKGRHARLNSSALKG
jgi:hypothetical protein